MRTGYFARATEKGHNSKSTQVHIENEGKGLCGYKPHKTMKFQWCAADVYLSYVECNKCKKIFEKMEKKNQPKLLKPWRWK